MTKGGLFLTHIFHKIYLVKILINIIQSLFYQIIIWIFLWFVGWGGWYLLPKNKRDYINNYIIVSIYFCFISFILIYIFRNILDNLTKNLSFFPIIILLVFFLFNFLIFFLTNKYLRKPIEFIDKYSTVHFLKMDYRYLLSKSFEIFFQQVLIITLVFILYYQNFSLTWITIIFMIMFGFAHIPRLKIGRDIFGLIIFVASIISSFLFPYLVLNLRYGYIYTFILHWLFYTNKGILFWIMKSKPIEEVKEIVEVEIKNVAGKIKEIQNPLINNI